jgi:hypothetical protein
MKTYLERIDRSKLVIIESPYGGTWDEMRRNERYARACLKHSLHLGEYPYASHLLYTQPGVLDDRLSGERQMGMEAGFQWKYAAYKTVVYTDLGISSGMQRGIELSEYIEQPVEYRTIGWPPPIETVYLAGPMEHAVDNGLEWRIRYEGLLKEWLEIECIVPNREEKSTIGSVEEFAALKKSNLQEYRVKMRVLKEMDLKFVQSVDAIICRWNGERMAGTIGEAQHATFHAIPFYLVCKVDFSEIPGWMLACATDIFPSSACLIGHLADIKWGQ